MVEKKIFHQHLSFDPSVYVRYVNDFFAIFNSSVDTQLFLNVLNNQHSNLFFTCEEIQGPSLRFLDIEVTICEVEFDIRVSHKPNFSGVLLRFNSIAPLFLSLAHLSCLFIFIKGFVPENRN